MILPFWFSLRKFETFFASACEALLRLRVNNYDFEKVSKAKFHILIENFHSHIFLLILYIQTFRANCEHFFECMLVNMFRAENIPLLNERLVELIECSNNYSASMLVLKPEAYYDLRLIIK